MKAIFIRLYQVCMVIPMFIALLLSTAILYLLFVIHGGIYWIITGINTVTETNFERVLDKLLRVCDKLMLKDYQ